MVRFGHQHAAIHLDDPPAFAQHHLVVARILFALHGGHLGDMRWLDIRRVDDPTFGFRDDFLCHHQHIAIGERQILACQCVKDGGGYIFTGAHFTNAAHGDHPYLSNHENSYQGRRYHREVLYHALLGDRCCGLRIDD